MNLIRKCRRLVAKAAFMRAKAPNGDVSCFEAVPPRTQAGVYWVGHSLMNETAPSLQGDFNVMRLVQHFAQSQNFTYEMFDHTLFGAPLSLQWRGQTHSYDRSDSNARDKTLALPNHAKDFDTYIFTEIVPVHSVLELEFSAYYLQQFIQCIRKHNPQARIYVYESWDYWNGTKTGRAPWHVDWVANMHFQRKQWEHLSDTANAGMAIAPTLRAQLAAILSPTKPQAAESPLYLVPVGQAFLRLHAFLKKQQKDHGFCWSDGRAFEFSDVFKNPYGNTPGDWPLAVNASPDLNKLALEPRDSQQELDDIHASIAGIYLAALVHFGTIYGQNPEGLPGLQEFSQELNTLFQQIAWEAITADARSGVVS